jgi:hypothetical protein
VFQPDKDKARIKFKKYLAARPHTTVLKELKSLSRIKRFTGKVYIINTW